MGEKSRECRKTSRTRPGQFALSRVCRNMLIGMMLGRWLEVMPGIVWRAARGVTRRGTLFAMAVFRSIEA